MIELGLRPVGLDSSRGRLQIARNHVLGRWVQADATRRPLRTASLDGVWSLHARLHVTDLDAALGELARALKPQGIAALTVALGGGVTLEPVPYQPDVVRKFVHRSRRAALATVRSAHPRCSTRGWTPRAGPPCGCWPGENRYGVLIFGTSAVGATASDHAASRATAEKRAPGLEATRGRDLSLRQPSAGHCGAPCWRCGARPFG